MKTRETDPTTSHLNSCNQVWFELSSKVIHFKEELKALALLLSLSPSWEVFYTTFTNSSTRLNLNETIGQILKEDIRRKSMGLIVNESTKEMTMFSLWEELQVVYEKKSSSSKLILIQQLLSMKMRESYPTTFHINIFNRVLFELSSQGINVNEEVKAFAPPIELDDELGGILHDICE